MTALHDALLAVRRYPAFALLWSSRLLSVVAFNILVVAVGWQLYDLTNDPLDLGLVGLFQFLPIITLTLLVGQVADRSDRRLVVTSCRVVQALAVVPLLLGTAGGWLTAPVIFAIVAVIGAARAFEDPTMTALMPGLVPRAEFARATVWYATASQVARSCGPAAGGLLYLLGPSVAYATGGVMFVLAALCTLLIRAAPIRGGKSPVTVASVFAGVTFAWHTPAILGSISLDLFVVLLGGATALLPIYARDILQTGPEGLGLLRSAPAVGALLMSLVLTQFPIKERIRQEITVSSAGAYIRSQTASGCNGYSLADPARRPDAVRHSDRLWAGDHCLRPVH